MLIIVNQTKNVAERIGGGSSGGGEFCVVLGDFCGGGGGIALKVPQKVQLCTREVV